jgi:T5SS/PEP-CTERM-associated repeat protein
MTLTNGGELFSGVVGGAGGHELYIGREVGSTGTLNVLSGSTVHSNGNWSAIVGQNGTGTMNVDSGGKFLADNWIVIGNEATSNGTVNIDGATSLIESVLLAGPLMKAA